MSTRRQRSSEPRPPRPWVRGLVIGVAVLGLGGAAVYEGLLTQRWGASADDRAAAAKLEGVPAAFGAWTSREDPIPEKVLKVAEATGHVSRIYTSRKTGAEVSVLLLCGPSGPIGAHSPEYCYAGSGFAMFGEPEKKTIALPNRTAASYWSVRFDKKVPPSEPLRVCWMWGTDGDWEAAANPRLGLRAALYKLYVVRNESVLLDRDPIHDFLTDFLPEVKKALAPTGPT